jgi:hypothetical protein
VKPVQPRLDPSVIRAAARLLEEDPAISNLRMLQRLARDFGPNLAQAVPVTRVERWVREPALLLIRTGALNGEEATPPADSGVTGKPEASRAEEPGPAQASGAGKSPARRRKRGRDPRVVRVARDVDEALVEAFALGAAAESPVEVVEAFRKLDVLRRKLRTRLAD